MIKLIVVAATLVGPAPAVPSTPAGPAPVTLRIDNAASVVSEHSQAHYRITVRNNSGVDYPAALIAQMLPDALSFGQADPQPSKQNESRLGNVHTNELQWVRHLPAHGEVTIDVITAVGSAGEKEVLTTTACVMPDGVTRPMICSSDRDKIVTGGPRFTWVLEVVIVVLGLAIAAFAWNRLSRRRRQSAVA